MSQETVINHPFRGTPIHGNPHGPGADVAQKLPGDPEPARRLVAPPERDSLVSQLEAGTSLVGG